MNEPDDIIREVFRVKRRDNLPYCGWAATRENLITVFAKCGFTKGAEIGVRNGDYSVALLKGIPRLELYCIDAWTAYLQTSNVQNQEARFQRAKDRLSRYPGAMVMRKTSMQAVCEVPFNYLDFVYIDAGHEFEDAMLDLIHWARRVRPGGIISGHDYHHGYRMGVVYAVDAYVRGNGITDWYVTNHDESPSWLWVKKKNEASVPADEAVGDHSGPE